MKRLFCVLLTVVLVLGLTACSGGEKQTDNSSPAALREVGVYKLGTDGFADVQSHFYDYFLNLIGFGHITYSDKNGDFADSELLQFTALRLSYEGKDIDAGLTLRDINRTATRYLGQKPSQVEGDYFTCDKENDLYFPKDIGYAFGQLMSLERLTVQENGICVGEFRRAQWVKSYGEGRTDDEIKQNFLSGRYEGLEKVEHVRVTFRERNAAAYGYYIEVLSIEKIAM